VAHGVDPAEAQRLLERLRVGDGLDAAPLLRDLQPDARRVGVVRL
jgi:hypothetical protein